MEEQGVSLRIPELGFIAGTRVALGFGLGLILAEKFSRPQRKRTGWALLAFGALTTLPIVAHVFRKHRTPTELAA